jgi:hypothetical protein
MAQAPQLPIQTGANLSSLDNSKENIELSDEEIDSYADALGLDDEMNIQEDIIEQEDGSVIVNLTPTEGPLKDPEFYANLAEEFDEGTLDDLSFEFLDLKPKWQNGVLGLMQLVTLSYINQALTRRFL